MTLTPGTRLGAYEIIAAIGAGGMGEVYRARDATLNREVALKVLPDLFALDADRLARFRREAHVLASLNHPNIAAIYGFEQVGDVRALVLELVDGATLSDLMSSGPIALNEALPIARQIAEALDAAHQSGVIHRDLKPANISLRGDGTVKVLDFGLAKALEPAGVAHSGSTASPTITSPALTQLGVILGTAAYMAPEQARGHAADKRSDIWAFGVVLFEMLTGRAMFAGESVSDTLASVLKTDPAWTALPAGVPPPIRHLLRWCLEKDPRRRLRDIGDARAQIDEVLNQKPDETHAATATRPGLLGRVLPWAIAGALAAALAITGVLNRRWSRAEPVPGLWMSSHIGADVTFTKVGLDVLTISPDGMTVAFVAQPRSGGSQLFVRRLDRLVATPLPGTEDATQPFFAPDGKRIGFFADGQLKTVAVTGGVPVVLSPAPVPRGGAWGEDETIVFQASRTGPMMRVPSHGGTPEILAPAVDGEATQRWPQFLPGGKKVLFTSNRLTNDGYNDASLVVFDIPAGTRKVVRAGGYHGRYLLSGHLVYVQNGALFGIAFDLDRMEGTGSPVSMIEGVLTQADTGAAQVAISATGTLAYQAGPILGGGIPFEWVSADGSATSLRQTRTNWFNLRFDPDGRRLAFHVGDGESDIWVYEWARESVSRFTTHSAADTHPLWTPDGRRLAFASTRGGSAPNLYWQRLDRSEPDRLSTSPNAQRPGSFHPAGRHLAFEQEDAGGNLDVMILPLDGDEGSGWKAGHATVFQGSSFNERDPQFSPDGRWLAYVSNESGRDEIHVRSFPGPGARSVISTMGGGNPVWSPKKQELFYGSMVEAQGEIMVVPFEVKDNTFVAHRARLWSAVRYQSRGPNRMFDVAADGTRLALARTESIEGRVNPDHLTFVFNFFDQLRAATPPSR